MRSVGRNITKIHSIYRTLQINRSKTKFLARKGGCDHVKMIKKNRRREQTNRNVIQNGEISERSRQAVGRNAAQQTEISDRLVLRKSDSLGHPLKPMPSGCCFKLLELWR